MSTRISRAELTRIHREQRQFEQLQDRRSEAKRRMESDLAPKEYVAYLTDDDIVIRQTAAQEIGKRRIVEAVPELIKLVSVDYIMGPERDLRIYAILALGEIGDERAVDALISFANADYEQVERGNIYNDFVEAVEALGKIGGEKAASGISELLETDLEKYQYDLLLEAAINALGNIGHAVGALALKKVLATKFPKDDAYSEMHKLASAALKKCE